jgi:hypothetical protein
VAYISKLGIVVSNLIMGFIAFWWFILSYATAVNIDHKEDAEMLVPVGVIALIMLPIIVIGINWAIYKNEKNTIKRLVLIQVMPFILGLIVSLLLALVRS